LIPWRDVLDLVAKIVAPGARAGPRTRGDRQGQHRVARDAPLLEWVAPVRSHRDEEMKAAQLLAAVAATVALLAGAPAGAQAKYPSKNIEVVVPFAPGGGTDNMMRMITAIIDENKWSPVPLNVNNRAGGSGTVGYSYLISKKGDSNVVAGATPMVVSGKLQGRLSGNHRDAMTMLMIVAIDELMLSVRSDSPYKTIEDFVAAARARPGQLTVGGTGTHNEDHIFAHLLEQSAKIKLKYVPFNSGGEATAALMGGHIDAGIMNPNEIVAQVEAGKARNLAVAAHKRMPGAPDLPTFEEKGYPFFWEQMRGVVGPAGMSPDAVAWWQETLKKVTATKKWQDDYIKANLLTPTTWTGEEANKYLDGITGKYEAALAELGGLKK
jgi:putative tricarboxylic transport membrane protein